MSTLTNKIKKLKNILKSLQPGILAVSGGIDSTVLANLVKKWDLDYSFVFFSGEHITDFEKEWVKKVFRQIEGTYREIEIELLAEEPIKKNQKLRCYFCKKKLFTKLKTLYPKKNIIEGSHLDDSYQYRPGTLALAELKVFSPFKDAMITKDDIIKIAYNENLNPKLFPSRPCLFTRFPYEFEITNHELLKLNKMETYLLQLGLRAFRVRKVEHGYSLHIEKLEINRLDKIYGEVQKKAMELSIIPLKIEAVEKISGYFDQKTKGGR